MDEKLRVINLLKIIDENSNFDLFKYRELMNVDIPYNILYDAFELNIEDKEELKRVQVNSDFFLMNYQRKI